MARLLDTATDAPVLGLRAMRGLRWRTVKAPKPRISTRSSVANASANV